jgi:ribosomal-protein-alanine N-acetyltransferase
MPEATAKQPPAPKTDFLLRPMCLIDLDRILELEHAAFSDPWSRDSFRWEIENNKYALCYVAVINDLVVGYAVCWLLADEFHIANLAVAAEYRRRGIGAWLLGNLLDQARRQQAVVAHLEVRRSNLEAIRLYRRFGFRVVGVRPNYYPTTGEDALLMSSILQTSDRQSP